MAKTKVKETKVDIIYEMIKRDITLGSLSPGEKININELSEKYDVSLTPVKLALNRLITEKVIENFPRQGMQVKSVSIEEINEIFDIRLMIDLYFTKEIITTVALSKKIQEEFEKIIVAHESLLLKESKTMDNDYDKLSIEHFTRHYELDNEFHELYLKCSGNSRLIDLYHFINPFLYTNYIYKKQPLEKDIAGVSDHRAIFDALMSRDENLLRQTITKHNRVSKQNIGLILKLERSLL